MNLEEELPVDPVLSGAQIDLIRILVEDLIDRRLVYGDEYFIVETRSGHSTIPAWKTFNDRMWEVERRLHKLGAKQPSRWFRLKRWVARWLHL